MSQRSSGCEFKSRHRIRDGSFVTISCFIIVLFETALNSKHRRGRGWPPSHPRHHFQFFQQSEEKAILANLGGRRQSFNLFLTSNNRMIIVLTAE